MSQFKNVRETAKRTADIFSLISTDDLLVGTFKGIYSCCDVFFGCRRFSWVKLYVFAVGLVTRFRFSPLLLKSLSIDLLYMIKKKYY